MYSDEMMKSFMDLLANPLFKINFFDFYLKMQREGVEAARRLWSTNPQAKYLFNGTDIFERMVDFYIVLGFVPRFKYDEKLDENELLRKENTFLKDTIKELQVNMLKEGGEQARETWKAIIDKQLEVNKEVSKNFFDLFRQLTSVGPSQTQPTQPTQSEQSEPEQPQKMRVAN